jgi:hypothetical protein
MPSAPGAIAFGRAPDARGAAEVIVSGAESSFELSAPVI